MTANDVKQKLKSLASPDVAKSSMRFFKTGPGQYGEGDTFIGIEVPTLRTVSREFQSLPLGLAGSFIAFSALGCLTSYRLNDLLNGWNG